MFYGDCGNSSATRTSCAPQSGVQLQPHRTAGRRQQRWSGALPSAFVAVDPDGKPSFNALQNYDSSRSPLFFYIFDLLILAGRDLMAEPLTIRRSLLEKRILSKLADPTRYSVQLNANLSDLITSVKAQGLEGLVAKRRNSAYEPGIRSGSWQKLRINRARNWSSAASARATRISMR